MITRRSDPWLSATLLVISVATLGRALQVGDGILKDGTMPWLAIAFATCAGAILIPAPRGRASYGRGELVAALVAVLIIQVGQMLLRVPFNEVQESSAWFARFRWGILGAGMLAGSMLLARGWLRHASFFLLLVACFLLGSSVIGAAPEPHIDVFVFQRDSIKAIKRGINPYTITFPDIYGPDAPWYGEGVVANGRVQFGYPYMPLTLFMAMPGDAFGWDFRYAQLFAIVLSAALIAYARPGLLSFGAAALLLLQPRGMYVLERGWSEPFTVLLLAGTVFCAMRAPRAMPWVLGLFLASKQYVPLGVGTALLLVGEPFSWRATGSMLIKAAVAAVVVTVPLVAWDFGAFWRSAVLWQVQQPFRWDSLSFVAWWMDGNRKLPAAALALPFIALIVATGVALWRCQRTAAGFAAGTALVFFSFFAFNKQAFANYYYLVIGAMCCAIAAAAPVEEHG